MSSKAPRNGKARDEGTRNASGGRAQEETRAPSPQSRDRSPLRSSGSNSGDRTKNPSVREGLSRQGNSTPPHSDTNPTRGRRSRSEVSPAAISLDNSNLHLVETDVWEHSSTPKDQGAPQSRKAPDHRQGQLCPREKEDRMASVIRMAIESGMRAMASMSQEEELYSPQEYRYDRYDSPYREDEEYDYTPTQSFHEQGQSEEMEVGQIQEELPNEQKGLVLSEDEGLEPEAQPSTGLFQPALFRSLLYKARATAKLPPQTAEKQGESTEVDPIFDEAATPMETIPTPKLFVSAITKQWHSPAGGAVPTTLDKRFFNLESNLTQHLTSPKVDGPILALYTSAQMPGDSEDLLKPEERRTEATLQRVHQSAAWAVRAAATTSFFCRTTLKWLHALKEHLPESDSRAHQDLNKLLAAAQFTSDSSLQSARFAARAMGSALVARRMTWLRGWSADARHKWKLATAPVTGQTLFGEALDPILVETKDKRKVLPSTNRKATYRSTAFARRGAKGFDNSYGRYNTGQQSSYQGHYQGGYQNQYQGHYGNRARSSTDRAFRGNTARRPFRGNGGRPFRRNKQ